MFYVNMFVCLYVYMFIFFYVYMYRITKERFEILANEIVYLFGGERTATYYIPFVQEGDFKIPTGGKLWHHYTYEKGRLKQADLLKGKNQITTHIITESGEYLYYFSKIIYV